MVRVGKLKKIIGGNSQSDIIVLALPQLQTNELILIFLPVSRMIQHTAARPSLRRSHFIGRLTTHSTSREIQSLSLKLRECVGDNNPQQ
jgi:hypothetical protein